MPILNMVWWWKKWGNIWEPLNLTVTAAWADATITWEDNEIWTIPPTTFQKSELVRKIGSAPTSPSDWTLVVTETVKDTYKVSGYVDSWLTGWETYYYRVFSYSDLWGISYCDAESVTIQQWWQPWVNTIAYYPFTSITTVNDQSWNSNNLTNNGVQFWTHVWVDCASFNGSSYMTKTESLFTGSATFTVNLWVNITTFSWSNNNILSIGASNSTNSFIIWFNNDTLMLGGRLNDANTWYTLPWNTRLNIVVTHSWGTVKVYVNWNKEYEWSVNYTISNNQTTIWGGTQTNKFPLIWYESELIVESIERTAQEVSDYFDLTKADYWIS